MARVVPWPDPGQPGFINLHWFKPAKTPGTVRTGLPGRPFQNIDAFMDRAAWAAANPQYCSDVYFCLSLQATVGKVMHGQTYAHRGAHTALALKAVWVDIDVKPIKGYQSVEEGLKALLDFCKAAGIPKPTAIVLSGGGIHAYWISNRILSVVEWTEYAEGLRNAAAAHGLKCDGQCTVNVAQVLRVPGTFNGKQEPRRPVKLIHLAPDDLDLLTAFTPILTAGPRITATVTDELSRYCEVANFPPRAPLTPGTDSLADGINDYNETLLNPTSVIQGCPHLREAFATGGKNYEQGLWMLDILASTFMDHGNALAHEFSKGYPSYSPDETEKMWERKLADKQGGLRWPSCEAFENMGCKLCGSCPHKGKIKSPLNLSVPKVPRAAPAVTFATSSMALVQAHPDLMLPDGYVLVRDATANEDVIAEEVTKSTGQGQTITEQVPLFRCGISAPVATKDPYGLEFTVTMDRGSSRRVLVLLSEMGNIQTLLTSLYRQGAKTVPRNNLGIPHFMVAWLTKLHAIDEARRSLPYGWLMNGEDRVGFCYGGFQFLSDGTVKQASVGPLQLQRHFKPSGVDTAWWKLHDIITSQNSPHLHAIAALGFAGPLLHVIGLNGGVMCVYSKSSGAHKSTSLYLSMAVWGNPKGYKENITGSMKGIMKKSSLLYHLPLFLDEVNSRPMMQAIIPQIGINTEGKRGTLLQSDRSLNEEETWASLLVVAANLSMWEEILRNDRSTDANLQRVFELQVPQGPDTHKRSEIQTVCQNLEANFGHVGLKYAAFLGRNGAQIKKMVDNFSEEFAAECGLSSKNRYWCDIGTIVIVGAALANMELGTKFDVKGIRLLMKQTATQLAGTASREAVIGDRQDNCMDAFTAFLKAHESKSMWSTNMAETAGNPRSVRILHGPPTIGTVQQSVEVHFVTEKAVVRVAETAFDEWFKSQLGQKYSRMAVFDGLKKFYGATVETRRVLAAGTPYAAGREPIFRVPLDAQSPLWDMLWRYSSEEERPANVGGYTEHPLGAGEPIIINTGIPPGITGTIIKAAAIAAADLQMVRGV